MSTLAAVNVVEEIQALKKERNAIILAHHYQEPEIQELADSVGDSLELARRAQKSAASEERSQLTLTQSDLAVLDHLFDLCDDTGVVQHATFSVPNRSSGYCVDDNARGLLLTAHLESASSLSAKASLLQSRCLSFVLDAYNRESGRFRNFMSYERKWLEDAGSEDAHGRSLWALGAMVGRCKHAGRREAARTLFLEAMSGLHESTSPRAWAFGVLAADEYLHAFPHEYSVQMLMQKLASRLWRAYEIHQCEDWPWFEPCLAYDNARLSQALIIAGGAIPNPDMLEVGFESLRWLMAVQTGPNGVLVPIGSNGFYVHGEVRAMFDQQPLEAWASVSACLSAEQSSGDRCWFEEARRSFAWFLGRNLLNLTLYDPYTGGCHDGLHPDRVNLNEGAESTLAFLCALAEMEATRPAQIASRAKVQPDELA